MPRNANESTSSAVPWRVSGPAPSATSAGSSTCPSCSRQMSVAVIRYDRGMGRWEPNARGRLELAGSSCTASAAIEQTTVAEIAKRAGLTERTFFRHFADKREVLFAGSAGLQELLVEHRRRRPGFDKPARRRRRCHRGCGRPAQERRDYARKRNAVIVANAELRERELIKLASLGGRDRRRVAAAWRQGAGGQPHRRDWDRHFQGRIRDLGRCEQ